MKERPIIFSAPMVRAILDGAKTQTRRIMKSQPISNNRGQFKFESATDWHNGMFWKSHCPYGKSGDRLWVREAWRIGAWDENRPALAIDYKADGFSRKKWLAVPDSGCDDFFERTWIQSSDDAEKAGLQKDSDGKYHWQASQSPCRWRPSIHMPRWASRIQLEITGVRVERLQDISEADARAEGIEGLNYHGQFWRDYSLSDSEASTNPMLESAIESYRTLWESINGAGSWSANQWVWVVEFHRKVDHATA